MKKRKVCMGLKTGHRQALGSLQDLARLVQKVDGFQAVVAALKEGRGATIDGAWGSSSALATAALGLHAPRTLLIVLAFPRDLDGWVEDIAGFSGQPPLVFPAWDTLPTDSRAVDEVGGQRLRVLTQLESG